MSNLLKNLRVGGVITRRSKQNYWNIIKSIYMCAQPVLRYAAIFLRCTKLELITCVGLESFSQCAPHCSLEMILVIRINLIYQEKKVAADY